MKQNPFDISFGKRPLESIDRVSQLREITDNFTAELITHQVYMITGVRGSGKTVMMNTIANTLEAEKEWVVVRLNPDRNLTVSFGAKLAANMNCINIFRSAKINLSFFGVGVELKNAPPVTDVESVIEQMLSSLKKNRKRILVTIDEVTNNRDIREFCSFFQILVGQELPVFMLMTGLYENIYDLQNEKTLTFLYRAPKIMMEPLNIGSIASRYEKIFQISREEAVRLARLTCGYPFAFQALGYAKWNHPDSEEKTMEIYRQLLEEFIYEKIWTELSAKDKLIVRGIAHSEDGKIKQINDYLNLKPNEINQYRKRLIRKGIVRSENYGYLTFTLPLFEIFVLEQP